MHRPGVELDHKSDAQPLHYRAYRPCCVLASTVALTRDFLQRLSTRFLPLFLVHYVLTQSGLPFAAIGNDHA